MTPMKLKPGSHTTVKVPAVPAVVPGTLPGTCPRQTFFNGNTCPRYRRQSACGTGRVELSSTFQAVPVPQADENFNGNTHPRYRWQAIDSYHNLILNSQSNVRKMAPKICAEEGGLILFLSFSNVEHERKELVISNEI